MLTSKQRSYLRRLANGLEAIFQIGKGGLDCGIVQGLTEALEARELIKVRVLENADATPEEACHEAAQRTGAEGVQIIGRTFVLYRPSKESPRIKLP